MTGRELLDALAALSPEELSSDIVCVSPTGKDSWEPECLRPGTKPRDYDVWGTLCVNNVDTEYIAIVGE